MWTAGGVIRPSRFVKASTVADNRVLECDAGERSFGISQEWSKLTPLPGAGTEAADTAGDKIKVYTLGEFCILELGSGGATRGDYLMPDADGKGVVVNTVGQNIGALCFESGAEGAKVRVQVDHFGSVPEDLNSITLNEVVFDGTTGTNEIEVPDNLADALSIKITGGADLITLASTNSNEAIAIGSAVTQKLGYWGTTPVVQPASANQAALGSVTTVGANTGTPGTGLSLIGDTTSVNQATNLMNDLAALREDIAALFTLVGAIRTALVDPGHMKGSA